MWIIVDFAVHAVSLYIAALCVMLTSIGVLECGRQSKYLEMVWGLVAFVLAGWLVARLMPQCEEKLSKLLDSP